MSSELSAQGYDLGDGRTLVPEPVVKAWLAGRGVVVPERLDEAADGPLVVKAYGPGIVHKSELGAVRLRVRPGDLAAAQDEMRRAVEAGGATAAGFLVEEQVVAGVEMIVGVVNHAGYGPMLAVGTGGVLAEALDDVAMRPLPVGADDVEAMVAELRTGSALTGARGAALVDLGAFCRLVALVGEAAVELGAELAELECNPVIVTEAGATAADARLILAEPGPSDEPAPAPTDFTALFEPRGVAVAGASTSKSIFGNWLIQALSEYGNTTVAAIHPTAAEVEGVPAYSSVDAVPHDIDYVIAAVPAAGCADLVAASGRAEFVHVISGGFRESGEDALERELMASARAAGVRLLGPNCMGTFSPKGHLTFQLDAPTRRGNVGVVSQSGGLAGDLIKLGDLVGLGLSKLTTVGNAVDVGPGELVDWLIDDPDTDIIGLYVEDPRDGARLVDALRRARGRVPVVVLVGGTSSQGARAVASHTGALAVGSRIWDGIAAATGACLVSTLEELVGTLRFLQRYHDVGSEAAPSVLIGGVGGGATVLAADACDRAGLDVRVLGPDAQAVLRGLGYGVGTSVVNPVEIPVGPKVPPERLADALREVLAVDAFSDVLVHMNVQSYYSFGDGGPQLVPFVEAVAALADEVPLALVLRNLSCAPGADRERVERACVEHGVVAFGSLGEAATGISARQRSRLPS